jgi:hydrogenase maturation protease
LRGDDAVGIEVARALRARSPRLDVHERSGDPLGLIALWEGADHVIIVDAVCSGSPAGTVHRFDPSVERLAPSRWLTSHKLDLAHTIELARRLGRLPPSLVLLGVEGACFELGAPLSAPVRQAARWLVEELLVEGTQAITDVARPLPADSLAGVGANILAARSTRRLE